MEAGKGDSGGGGDEQRQPRLDGGEATGSGPAAAEASRSRLPLTTSRAAAVKRPRGEDGGESSSDGEGALPPTAEGDERPPSRGRRTRPRAAVDEREGTLSPGGGSGGAGVAVVKVRQAKSWDCGLACCSMVLRTLAARGAASGGAGAASGHAGGSLAALTREVGGESVWTIDLAYMLTRHGANVVFHTVTIGANQEFSNMSFYTRELREDGDRVNRLFERAAEHGVRIQHKSLPLDEMRERVATGRSLFIVLTDLRYLKCQSCWLNLSSWFLFSFAGHYVVVSGFDAESDTFVYHDPAARAAGCTIRAADLERARKSFGTDEDVVEVLLPDGDGST